MEFGRATSGFVSLLVSLHVFFGFSFSFSFAFAFAFAFASVSVVLGHVVDFRQVWPSLVTSEAVGDPTVVRVQVRLDD